MCFKCCTFHFLGILSPTHCAFFHCAFLENLGDPNIILRGPMLCMYPVIRGKFKEWNNLLPVHWRLNSFSQLPFLLIYLFIFREKEMSEKEGERNINVWLPLAYPQLETWPASQARVLTGNRTGNPLVGRPALNPLSHTSWGMPFLSFSRSLKSFCVLITVCRYFQLMNLLFINSVFRPIVVLSNLLLRLWFGVSWYRFPFPLTRLLIVFKWSRERIRPKQLAF